MKYNMIVDYIRKEIAQGKLASGDKIPSIRELCDKFSSTKTTAVRAYSRLKELGIKIAIDDFGTGYSSLARERELNVDILKIDKYFSDKIMTLGDKDSITADIISMAHKLGHCVIAEGIEHEKQRQYMQNNGCDRLQGYLISRPVDENTAIELLINN